MQAQGVAVRVDELPGLAALYPTLGGDANAAVAPYPRAAETTDERAVTLYIHSSGSTGHPKSVPFTHRRMLQWVRHSTPSPARSPSLLTAP